LGAARGDEHGAAGDEARELLAPVYGRFTGFDTLDLKQAKALLDQLA
jgi:hypothetical protein